AVCSNDIGLVRYLLEQKACVDFAAGTVYSTTALTEAIYYWSGVRSPPVGSRRRRQQGHCARHANFSRTAHQFLQLARATRSESRRTSQRAHSSDILLPRTAT